MLTELSRLGQRTQSQWVFFRPLPLRMSETGDPTTSGCSSWLSPGKVDRPVMHRLVGVRNVVPSGWEGRECVLGMDAFRGHPVMGLKLYIMGCPHHRKTGGQKFLNVG